MVVVVVVEEEEAPTVQFGVWAMDMEGIDVLEREELLPAEDRRIRLGWAPGDDDLPVECIHF